MFLLYQHLRFQSLQTSINKTQPLARSLARIQRIKLRDRYYSTITESNIYSITNRETRSLWYPTATCLQETGAGRGNSSPKVGTEPTGPAAELYFLQGCAKDPEPARSTHGDVRHVHRRGIAARSEPATRTHDADRCNNGGRRAGASRGQRAREASATTVIRQPAMLRVGGCSLGARVLPLFGKTAAAAAAAARSCARKIDGGLLRQRRRDGAGRRGLKLLSKICL